MRPLFQFLCLVAMTNFPDSKIHRIFMVIILALAGLQPVQAADRIYQAPDDFIAEVFALKPQPKLLWLSKEVQAEVSRILGHAPRQLRQRYWSDGSRTLWILEEIGKEDLITAGFVVRDGRIEQAKVLVYRESRGMEVRYPAFLNQFKGMSLAGDNRLAGDLDGISGATMSVNAMERMARTALYFDSLAREMQQPDKKGSAQ